MYYVKIPLRNLCAPDELNLPEGTTEDERKARWSDRVENLLGDVRNGLIPGWAVDCRDLRNVVLGRDREEQL